MERLSMSVVFFSVLLVGFIEARSVTSPKGSIEAHTVAGSSEGKKTPLGLINPKLEDVASDKKFFGPPFPADYPSDARPTMKPDHLKELKENNKPYPYLQNRNEYDKDYVKDENNDNGMWKAQFDYDAYRKLLADEEERNRRAKEAADKEGRDEDDAKKNADDADKNARDARKDLDDAKNGGKDDGKDSDGKGGDGLSAEEKKKLEDLEKKVKEAEDNYAQAKKDFEECKRQLEAAEKEVADLKKELAEYEDYVQSQSQLWAVKQTEDKKVRQSNKEAASAKVKLAQAKLDMALEVKKEREAKLAKEKAEHVAAQKVLDEHLAKLATAKQKLEAAALHLQTLRGHKMPTPAPAKSGASLPAGITSVFWMLLASAAANLF